MNVKLWGVRGSLPTPMNRSEYHEKLICAMEHAKEVWQRDPAVGIDEIISDMHPNHKSVIGGETTCLEISSEDTILIFDLGTGARNLGADLLERGHRGELHIFLTHTHWDHIQGFPFFLPAYEASSHIHFYSCLENLEERFSRQQHFEHFPVAFSEMPASMEFHYTKPGGSFEVGPFSIQTRSLIHPGGSIAYRVSQGDKVTIFATDTEFYGPELANQMQEYAEFFSEADLLLLDAQYSLKEAEEKRGWGHTAMTLAVDCALYWRVRQLILTHHEPAHQDKVIWKLFSEAKAYLEAFQGTEDLAPLQIYTAKEGDSFKV